MRRVNVRLISAGIAACLAWSIFSAGVASAACPAGTPDVATATDERVTSFDGVQIAVSVFRPSAVCDAVPVPVILRLHGWAASRVKADQLASAGDANASDVLKQIKTWLDEGYGVVTIDARGHGESGGQALVQHPSREVRDYRAVLDYLYSIPWILKEGAPEDHDVRVGALEGSYGGGFQLMTAAFDRRLDAIVPVVTWNDLTTALSPNGAVKTDWLAGLYALGAARARVDPRLHEWVASALAMNRFPDELMQSFKESSPATWIGQIHTPTMLLQGLPDTLFPLNEAVRNYLGLRANGVEAWLVGFNGGHVLPGLQPTGVNAPGRVRSIPQDCGGLFARPPALDFLDAHLKEDLAAQARLAAMPRVTLALEQGGCVTAADWPPNPGLRTITLPALAVPQAGGSALIPLFTAEEHVVVGGIPRLRAAVPVALDEIFYLSLVLRDADGLHVVDDQVMAVRLEGGALLGQLDVELAGVATKMQQGDGLFLRIDGANEQHAAGSRRPGALVLTDVVLDVPVM